MTDDRTSSKAQRTVIIVGVDGSEDGLRAARYAAGSAIKSCLLYTSDAADE